MIYDDIRDEYFEWLFDIVCEDRFSNDISFRKLLTHLHRTEFQYSIANDQNRAEDGISLRYRFALLTGREAEAGYVCNSLDGPCSILEMMIALAIRCEETITDDPRFGDRTGQWFWGMIVNLDLGRMTDDRYNAEYVDDVLYRFIKRKYDYDGKGGLFTIRHCDRDMTKTAIWFQLQRYLDGLV